MATEYKLPYTALDINRRLGKIDEIDSLKDLVGAEPVQKQISDAVKNIGEAIKTDTTLKVRGKAADSKAVGDAIANSKVEIDKTLKVSGKAADAKVTGDEITKLNNLVGDTPVADRIATAVEELAGNVYTHPDTHPASMITGLSGVATSGDYNDLSNLPEQYVHPESHPVSMITGLADIATSGNYEDLINKPIIPEEYTHPETHPVDMITGLSDIAISGDYADLKNKPTIPDEYVHPSTHSVDMITGLSGVAVSGDYNDLINKPDISGEYIHPESHPASMITGLANVAVSGNYEDLSNKPTIPDQYVHPDTHSTDMITGLSDVATSGSYNDLTDKPTIPSIDGLATVAYVDEKFANVGESGGSGTSTGLPEFTTEDEGKVLSIKDGAPSWESISSGDTTTEVSWNDISDKPFGEERGLVDLLPETTYGEFYYYDGYGVYMYDTEAACSLSIGATYIVTWDGQDYICVGQDGSDFFSGCVILGNAEPFGFDGNAEPFVLMTMQGTYISFAALTDTEPGAFHTVRIAQEGLIINKIDPKYLPDTAGDSSLPEVSTEDAGKFLRVGTDGNWIVEALQDVSEVGL